MSLRHPRGSLQRSVSLIALGALAVHELRYQVAFGSQAPDELERQGHAYLDHALPALIAIALAGMLAGLLRVAIVRGSPSSPLSRSRAVRALGYGALIAVVFCSQELLEGVLFSGHPTGIGALSSHGAWLAFPLSAAIGLIAAVLDGGLSRLEAAVADQGRSRPRMGSSARHLPRQLLLPLPAASPLAFGLARRPPPPAIR